MRDSQPQPPDPNREVIETDAMPSAGLPQPRPKLRFKRVLAFFALAFVFAAITLTAVKRWFNVPSSILTGLVAGTVAVLLPVAINGGVRRGWFRWLLHE
jgi:hypothetical protein